MLNNKDMPSSEHPSVFILCAGRAERWNNYLGIPKQLIAFNNESLLDRTIRLIKSALPHSTQLLQIMNNY
jgi:choline kinase